MNLVKRIVEKLLKRLHIVVIHLKYSLLDLFCSNSILINYWIPPYANPQAYNFGDDINLILMQLISGKKVIPYKYAFPVMRNKRINYLCIGSIISQLTNSRSFIWGSGAISPDLPLGAIPLKVLAVRGPLSRQYLINNGIACPEVYGDPALLLPRYYKPQNVKKKYNLGIIPHYKDKENALLKMYAKEKGVSVLDIVDYGKWTDFIDRICECEFIISSSLHGIIVSDAYGVPNKWTDFSSSLDGGKFKFEDYYLSVHKHLQEPLILREYIPVNQLTGYKDSWQSPVIDLDLLMNVCPFK